MSIVSRRVELADIETMRDIYRHEMNCQIIHDSIHARPGWSIEYLLVEGGTKLGYGSIAVGGPWLEQPTVYEFFVLPHHRSWMFDVFEILLAASQATTIETQSNDALLTVMLHTYAREVASESILFHDRQTTSVARTDAVFRRSNPDDVQQITREELDPEASWLVSVEGRIAAAGDILFHYNRPYGDIYMKVAESFRRRGLGTYLVQELKRVCYDGGSVPAARCNVTNVASRKTLQRAGFAPCGHILKGAISNVDGG
jgi:GNAT superfamily N-acetyltransferase